MTKADIAEKIQIVTGGTKKESAELMEAVFSIMKAALETGETLKISGFGSFVVKQKADRRGRMPPGTVTRSSARSDERRHFLTSLRYCLVSLVTPANRLK